MLELHALTIGWTAHKRAFTPLLHNVNLSIAAGQTVALLGPSGSGKSTLLKVLAGLEPPESGSVWLDGQDISTWPPEKRGLALLFQDYALFPHLSVQDNVAFGLIEKGLPRKHAREHASALLVRFGLHGLENSRTDRLSGGEQQRIALARALITQPKGLLLDEPFAALDSDLKHDLRAEFRARIAEWGMHTLWVTHDETEAQEVASQGWRIQEKRLVQLW